MSIGKKGSNIVVWILMAMLIVGLGGFGVSNFGGSIDSIGTVGDEEITVDEYARELQRELSAQEAATGQNMTLAQAEQLGIVNVARGRVIASAALDNEVKRMGVSVGDAAVAQQVMAIEAFQGLDGTFDREGYRFALQQNGLTEEEFETEIREETARTLLQGAVVSGVRAPQTYLDEIYTFIAERRSYAMIALDETALDGALPQPTDDQIAAFYADNEPAFTAPQSKDITYAWLTPDMILATVEVDEEALQTLYDERRDEFISPERRLVERLVFGSVDEAESAFARLEAEEITFDALVEERGLSLQDVDMGDVSKEDLGAAGDAVFALDAPAVSAPQQSDFGPALFRVNAVLEAQETTLDEVRDELKAELAQDRARRIVADQITDIDDRLAAGATLEDLAAETEMELGEIAYSETSEDGIAGYESFREAAAKVTERDFPEVIELDDGGIFALRLNGTTPATLRPLAEVRADVIASWQAEETARLLAEQADALKARLDAGEAIDALGQTVETGAALTRGAISPIDIAEPLFALDKGQATVVRGDSGIYLVQLTDILPPDAEDPAAQFLRTTLEQQAAQGLSQDLFGYFAESLLSSAGLTLDQAAINAVHAQFP